MFLWEIIDTTKCPPDINGRHWWSSRLATTFFVLVVLAAGLWVRCVNLGTRTLWVDEAESAINALTILEHGVPVNHYLDLPIYENTLIQSWPENDEYEFRDISYSDRGLMIYHGWFPIYSIAASFALFGVKHDEPMDTLSVRHTDEEMSQRTYIPRLPSVLFSMVFLILLFKIGYKLGGPATAWAALMAGSFASSSVSFGNQARYYSASLMLTAACVFMLLKMIQKGRWRDYLLGACCFVLLFHTHLIACVIMGIMMGFLLPNMLRHQRIWAKFTAMGLIFSAGTVPWIIFTGFLDMFGKYQKAIGIMKFPEDLWLYFKDKGDILILLGFFLLYGASMMAFHKIVPKHFSEPFIRHRHVYVFLLVWLLISYALFILIIPAPSFFLKRMLMLHLVPGILLGALLFADVCRIFSRRKTVFLSVAMMLLFLGISGRIVRPGFFGNVPRSTMNLINYLRFQSFEKSTKLYASPNSHLILQYYAGLPVQSIAPVNKEYLDNYEGPIVFIERIWIGKIPDWKMIQQKAQSNCMEMVLSEQEAKRWARRFHTRPLRKELLKKGYQIFPALEEIPESFQSIEKSLEDERNRWIDQYSKLETSRLLILRGYSVKSQADWWQTYFYRFVNPLSRKDSHANYADRLFNGKAVILPDSERVIYYSSF